MRGGFRVRALGGKVGVKGRAEVGFKGWGFKKERSDVFFFRVRVVARGGEVKYINWKEATWDPFLQCLVLTWKEKKTFNRAQCQSYPMKTSKIPAARARLLCLGGWPAQG